MRAGGALFVSFFLCWFFGPSFIAWLKRKQGEGQPIRDDGPQTHLKKKGKKLLMEIMVFGFVLIMIKCLSME